MSGARPFGESPVIPNLEPFYLAVDQYQLYRWLPVISCLMLLATGVLMILQSASKRKDSALGVFVGLFAAFLLLLLPLSVLAITHAYGAQWNAQLLAYSQAHPLHWQVAAIAAGFILLTMVAAGLRGNKALAPTADVLMGLLLALHIPFFIALYYLVNNVWWPTWSLNLKYAVPISATILVGISTLCYSVRSMAPRAKAVNFGYQVLIAILLAGLAYMAVGNYLSWGKWRYGAFVNAYEFYHYYIGSKYSPEVGYFNMYNASLIADDQTGKQFNKTQIRDLVTGVKVDSKTVLADKDKYIALFGAEGVDSPRWQEFLMDIRWFKTKLTPTRFSDMISDKGYNATPVWTMLVGGILSENISTTDPAPAIVDYPVRAYRGVTAWIFGGDIYPDEPNGMLFLALVDVMLITLATGCVVWAFGLRAAFLMLIVLGTSYVMSYSHMKGAYLRTDFTMSLIIGICLLKKDQYALAGSFIAYSCLSRVFPAVFFFGVGAKLAWHAIGALPVYLEKTKAPGAVVAFLAAAVGMVAGLLGLGPKIVSKLTEPAVPGGPALELGNTFQLALKFGFGVATAGILLLGVVILWGWWTRNVPRRYLSFFTTAAATVGILVTAAFFYHSAVKPAHAPLNYKDKIGEEGSLKRKVGNFLAEHFDGGMTVFGEYAQKIGKHNTDISPWRVGFKYWFIGVGGKRPLWAGWQRAEKGETGWVHGEQAAAAPPAGFLGGLMNELRGPDEAVRNSPAFEKIRDSGSFERIRYREPGADLSDTFWKEFKDNAVVTRSSIHRQEKRGIYNLILLIVLAISFFLVPAFKDHEATAWSFVLVFFLVSATYYYFIMLLVPLLFFSPYLNRPSRALGVMALLMAAWPGYYLYTQMGWKQTFATYYHHSLMYFVLTLYMMLLGAAASLRLLGKKLTRSARHKPTGAQGTPA